MRKLKTLINLIKNRIRFRDWLSLDTVRVSKPASTHQYGKSNLICIRGAEIRLGESVTLNSKQLGYHGGMPCRTTLIADKKGARIHVGSGCRINGAYIHACKSVSIGNNCVIASGVNILDSNGHELISGNRTSGTDIPKEIEIGNNVWVCMNAIILKGTRIGDNCVIGANSVVKGFFPANAVIQGNPAQIVSYLPIQ